MIDVPALVDIDEAKRHLRASGVSIDTEAEIESKLAQATGIILDYVNTTAYWRAITVTWDEATVPVMVHAAILAQLASMYTHRGDSEAPPSDSDLAPGVAGLLRRTRDPVIA